MRPGEDCRAGRATAGCLRRDCGAGGLLTCHQLRCRLNNVRIGKPDSESHHGLDPDDLDRFFPPEQTNPK